jgi:hypothetical protein
MMIDDPSGEVYSKERMCSNWARKKRRDGGKLPPAKNERGLDEIVHGARRKKRKKRE